MRRLVAFFACLLCSATASAAELDDQGKLHSTKPGAVMIGFDDALSLSSIGARLTRWQGDWWQAQLVTEPILGEGSFVGRTLAGADVLEGSRAIRLGLKFGDGATGILIPGDAIRTQITSKRFEITFWAKADGATPRLTAGYSTAKPFGQDFVSVAAIRTGRETSDGWTEFTTGTIDAEIWGVPLSGIHLYASPRAPATSGFLLDALEIVPVGGSTVAPVSCTQADVDLTCGAEGDCQYGHCIPGYAAWGPLPSRPHREDLVNRWIHLVTRVHGDRASHENAKGLVSDGPPLAWYSTSSRPFFAGIKRLHNQLRDHHTSFGYPSAALFFPIAFGGGSATVGACFGPGRHDLIAPAGEKGDLGYIVYRAAKFSPVGVPLKRGDALTKIDGKNPRDWVHDVWGGLAGTLPNDPGAELGWSATGLSWLIEKRAKTIEITRCLSDTRCDGAYRSVMTINVADPIYANTVGTGSIGRLDGYFGCDIRFQDSIDTFAPNVRGENTVSGQIVRGDVLAVQFDGTYGTTQWSPSMEALFPSDKVPTKVLFDVRQGNGGHGFNSETVVKLIRPSTQPIGQILMSIGDYGGADVSALLEASKSCEGSTFSNACLFSEIFFNKDAEAVAKDARVAFLNTADVSANDFLARLVKGREKQMIFSPGPTSGAFGSISSIPSFLVGWGGGSMQMQDSRFGATFDDFASARWESGHGVEPDVVITETMSDAIRDRDTMVEAAHAWLKTGTLPEGL
ncbi:MAG: hypothetical protein ACXWP4_04240 [Polyangiales bacterium]